MELQEILKSPGLVIVDLRKPDEFAVDHIKESINIPMEEVPSRIDELKNMSRPIVLCCATGKDCRSAHIYLSQHGLQNTYAGGSWLELNVLKTKS